MQLKMRHKLLLLVLVVSVEIWTTVTCNGTAIIRTRRDASDQSAVESKLQPLKLEKFYEDAKTKLIDDIKSGAFEGVIAVLEGAKSVPAGKLMLTDLVKVFLSISSATEFTHLYKFVQFLAKNGFKCNALAAMWKKLQDYHIGDSLEALQVWSYATYISKNSLMDTQECVLIANSPAPQYRQIIFSTYDEYIDKISSKMLNLHKINDLKYVFVDYINSLSIDKLQNENFNKFINTVYALIYTGDACYAAAAVYEKIKGSPGMIGTFEHLQILQIIRRMKEVKKYANLDEIAKSKCESVAIPRLFQNLLYGDPTNCRLMNRFYEDEALFVSIIPVENEDRLVATWIPKSTGKQDWGYWDIVVSMFINGISLRSRDYDTFRLRYIDNNVRASNSSSDIDYDFFRIHTMDDDYILLEPMREKLYVGATDNIAWKKWRNLDMINDPNDKRTHWRLLCY